MKAKSFLLGLCAFALAACSIDETTGVNDTNAISFKATTATRATAATTNNIDAFTVWAWNTVGGATSEFMKGVEAVRSGSTFVTSPTYYWPGGTLDFYAFIPAAVVETDSSTDYNAHFGEEVDLTGDVIETASGVAYDTYKGYVANAAVTDPSAISFEMHVPADAAEGIDLCYAATLGQSSGTVGLNFRHALSQVAFKAMNGNADWTVDIQGVTLCGIHKEGTCTLPEFGEAGTTEHNSATATKLEWTVGEVQGRFNAGIAETKLEGTSSASQSITAEGGALMLIPQTVAAWDPATDPTNTEVGAYIRIRCKVTDTATNEQIWPNYHELDSESARLDYADITVPFDVDWLEGNLYTYTIVFGEGLGYYAPDDENTDLDGTPVLIPIRFTVDINDFGNLDDVDVTTETEPEPEPEPLILEYTIKSNNTTIQLPISDVTNAKIDWGDGSGVETVNSDWPSHIYPEVGTYTVSISGTVEQLLGASLNWSDEPMSLFGSGCLTAVKQWGDLGLTSMEYAFNGCSGLTSLPDGPGPFENVTSLDYAFAFCGFEKMPDGLFDNCTNVTTFRNAFYNCTSLKELPEGLFDNCTKVTSFEETFRYCESLKELPKGLFDNCTEVTNFKYTFQDCTSLEKLPDGLFDNCTKVTSFENVFAWCSALKEAPTGLFDNCTECADFDSVFYDCTNLVAAPSFEGLSKVTTFLRAFSNCTSLVTVPENIFSGCTAVTTFDRTFSGCTSLATIPVDIFSDCTAVTVFSQTFYNCSSVSGESPYTKIEVSDGVWDKVHLYERENYPEYFTTPTSYRSCFNGATFSDIDDIPSSWGGNTN